MNKNKINKKKALNVLYSGGRCSYAIVKCQLSEASDNQQHWMRNTSQIAGIKTFI